jgi:hypothetical protein
MPNSRDGPERWAVGVCGLRGSSNPLQKPASRLAFWRVVLSDFPDDEGTEGPETTPYPTHTVVERLPR